MKESTLTNYKIVFSSETSNDIQYIVGKLTGEITKRAGQLSKSTMQFIVTIDGHLWRG